MVSLSKLFERFPGLLEEKKLELARRRLARFLAEVPYMQGKRYDVFYAFGYLGLSPICRR